MKPKFLRALSPNCREATEMQSQWLDGELPFSARLGLRLHWMICASCRNFARQTHFLRQAFQRAERQLQRAPRHTLPPEVRKEMKARLTRSGGKGAYIGPA